MDRRYEGMDEMQEAMKETEGIHWESILDEILGDG